MEEHFGRNQSIGLVTCEGDVSRRYPLCPAIQTKCNESDSANSNIWARTIIVVLESVCKKRNNPCVPGDKNGESPCVFGLIFGQNWPSLPAAMAGQIVCFLVFSSGLCSTTLELESISSQYCSQKAFWVDFRRKSRARET